MDEVDEWMEKQWSGLPTRRNKWKKKRNCCKARDVILCASGYIIGCDMSGYTRTGKTYSNEDYILLFRRIE